VWRDALQVVWVSHLEQNDLMKMRADRCVDPFITFLNGTSN